MNFAAMSMCQQIFIRVLNAFVLISVGTIIGEKNALDCGVNFAGHNLVAHLQILRTIVNFVLFDAHVIIKL